MAQPDNGRINNKQYPKLADAISAPSMDSIAQGYLNIDPEIIASIKHENLNKVTPSNIALLRRWANRTENSGPDQRKVSMHKHTHTHTHSTHTLANTHTLFRPTLPCDLPHDAFDIIYPPPPTPWTDNYLTQTSFWSP